MKIIAIRIRNLASLEGDTEIVFDQAPLSTAGIFAITGPTGAGKSTILDALCLALYAKTPRYKNAESGVQVKDVSNSTINQNDVRGILRDGTGEGFAEVDFKAVNGQSYRARWIVKRARGKVDGNLQDYEMKLSNLSTSQDEPGRKTEILQKIEQLIGLNFEQFTRSVLLAQGDFTAFLKSDKNEKAALLEKLTGTDIYSKISERVYKIHANEKAALDQLGAQVRGIPILAEADREEAAQKLTELTASLPEKEQGLAVLDRALDWHITWISLQEKNVAAEEAYQVALVQQTAAANRSIQLENIRSVQSIRSTVDALDHSAEQIQHTEETLISLQQQREALQASMELIQAAVVEASTALQQAENLYVSSKQDLQQARELDIRISSLNDQLVQLEADYTKAEADAKELSKQIGDVNQEFTQVGKDVVAYEEWFEKHEERRKVAEQEMFIYARLDQADTLLSDLSTAASQNKRFGEDLLTHKTGEKQLQTEQAQLQQALDGLRAKLKSLRDDQDNQDLSSLQSQVQRVQGELQDLQSAWHTWTMLYASLMQEREWDTTLEELRTTLANLKEEKVRIDQQMPVLKARVDTEQEKLDLAKLAVSADVERMRSVLKEEEPCPVCGSKEHPYATHNEPLVDLEQTLRKAYELANTAYVEEVSKSVSNEKQIEEKQQRITDLDSQRKSKQAILSEQQSKWDSYACKEEAEKLPEADRADWLQQQVAEKKTLHSALQKQMDALQQAQTSIHDLEKRIGQEELMLSQKDSAIQKASTNITVLEEKIGEQAAVLSRVQVQLDRLKLELDPMFPQESWYDNWAQNPVDFREKIRVFAETWRTKSQSLQVGKVKLANVQSTLDGLNKQMPERLKEVANKKNKLEEQQKILQNDRLKRQTFFGGKPVDEVEQAMLQGIKESKRILDEKQLEQTNAEKKVTDLDGQRTQLEKQLTSLQQQHGQQRSRLDQWLGSHSLLEEVLRTYLSYSNDWIQGEANALQVLSDTVTRTDTLLKQVRQDMEAHLKKRSDERSKEALMLARAELDAIVNTIKHDMAELRVRLQTDTEQRARIGDLQQQIDRQALIVESWARLNEVIGSADGKKFRQVAQEHTLDVLLGYANVHLQMLSRRYVLERIPDTLGLQVRDQDMGDEVRTVFSLSGGESFLVSLALALGLASLSSSQMNVESLFIDEGFGSLDPDTLNIAMDALERLHSQGRKVGVISHVQEMTERIPVQIRVRRRQNGKSKVEVTRQ
jgi:exonuclease SbcC